MTMTKSSSTPVSPTQSAATQLCAVIGNPIDHSRSPDIHHAFAQALQLPVRYERLLGEPEQFETQVQDFFRQGGRGLNVTVPFKERAYQLTQDHCSPRAQLAGAVNTLWHHEGQLYGCNTDGEGLVFDLKRLAADPQEQQILLLGAGGAARGVIIPLLEAGCQQIRILNRRPERAQQLVAQALAQYPQAQGRLSAGSLSDTKGSWDIVINATSASLSQQAPAHGPLQYRPQSLAYDMVYGAQPTPFMRQALAQGAARSADGLGMLVEQAASSFALWFGQRPPTEPVIQRLRNQL